MLTGYRIVRARRTGWLAKCGYDASAEGGKLRSEVLNFLDDLEVVAGIMDLAVVGFHKETRWLDLALCPRHGPSLACLVSRAP